MEPHLLLNNRILSLFLGKSCAPIGAPSSTTAGKKDEIQHIYGKDRKKNIPHQVKKQHHHNHHQRTRKYTSVRALSTFSVLYVSIKKALPSHSLHGFVLVFS